MAPLPPLAEQHRIVAKVEELLALCDELEARLTTAQTSAAALLDASLHEILAECTIGSAVSGIPCPPPQPHSFPPPFDNSSFDVNLTNRPDQQVPAIMAYAIAELFRRTCSGGSEVL